MELFTEVAKFTGIDMALLSVGAILAIILRYARGMVHWVEEKWTVGGALVLALAGAVLKMAEHEPWRVTGFNALSLLLVVLVGQKILQAAAEKLSWLPRDNEWLPKGGTK